MFEVLPALPPAGSPTPSSVGSLRRCLPGWVAAGTDRWAQKVVKAGYLCPFLVNPPLTTEPLPCKPPAEESKRRALQTEVDALLEKGAIYPVSARTPGFYARLFTVPKKNGKLRPVLDLSALNKFLKRISFKMETMASVRLAIRRGDWATSIDLQDAYFHILMHKSVRKYLRFIWGGQAYEWRALPFGLSLAPLIFTKMAKQLAKLARRRSIRLRMYLDDWLNLSESRVRCAEHTQFVLHQAAELGFVVNREKSDLVPAQCFKYLGMAFDTVHYVVRPTEDRLLRFSALLAETLARSSVSNRQLRSILGHMESLAPLLPLGRLYKRPLQLELSRLGVGQADLEQMVQLGPWFRTAVEQWLDPVWLHSSVPIQTPPISVYLHTDASKVGWGAHTDLRTVSGFWTAAEAAFHINLLEMEAVARALKALAPSLRNQSVCVCGDNTTCLAYLRNQGGVRSPSLARKAAEILLWCQTRQISLTIQFIPGKLNVVADLLSRSSQVLQTEWTIAHQALRPLWDLWGKPHVDLFATRFNHRLSVYVSPVRDPAAWARDALAISWKGLDAYAYPPTALIPRVLAKFLQDRPRLVIVTPYWPASPWFAELMSLTRQSPRKLNLRPRDLVQPRTGIQNLNTQFLDLTAWLL